MKKIDDYQEVEELENDIEIVEEFVDISDSLIELEKNIKGSSTTLRVQTAFLTFCVKIQGQR